MKDYFYRDFELLFRGDRSEIKKRLRVYLPFVQPLLDLYPDAVALDEAVNLYLGGLADGLAHPRFAGHYEQTDQVGDLYREAARSLARISIGPRTAAGSPAATGPVAP